MREDDFESMEAVSSTEELVTPDHYPHTIGSERLRKVKNLMETPWDDIDLNIRKYLELMDIKEYSFNVENVEWGEDDALKQFIDDVFNWRTWSYANMHAMSLAGVLVRILPPSRTLIETSKAMNKLHDGVIIPVIYSITKHRADIFDPTQEENIRIVTEGPDGIPLQGICTLLRHMEWIGYSPLLHRLCRSGRDASIVLDKSVITRAVVEDDIDPRTHYCPHNEHTTVAPHQGAKTLENVLRYHGIQKVYFIQDCTHANFVGG